MTSITITSPANYQIFQRDGSDQADIPITGTYVGSPAAVEAQFAGGGWSTIDAAPAGGTFSGTLSTQAAGQGLLTVRFTDDTEITDDHQFVGIGDVFVVAGQSNAMGKADQYNSYSHATLKASMFRQDDTWAELTDPTDNEALAAGSVWPLLATYVMADTGYPVAFVTTAKNGAELVAGDAGWTKNNAQYADCVQTVDNSGVNSARAILWHQGESDVNGSISTAAYEAALSQMLDDLQADVSALSGVPLICAQIGYKTLNDPTRADLDAIREAHTNRWASDGDIYRGPVTYDIGPLGDGVHFGATEGGTSAAIAQAQMDTLALRWWQIIDALYFSGNVGRGPVFASAAQVGARHIDVTITVSNGLQLYGGSTTGWRIVDDTGVLTIGAAEKYARTKVRLVTTRDLDTNPLVSFGSFNDGVGSDLADLSGLPLEPFWSETVSALPAAVVSWWW